VLCGLLAVWNGAACLTLLQEGGYAYTLDLALPPIVRIIGAASWSAIFTVWAVRVWRLPNARRSVIWVCGVYALYGLVIPLVFTASDYGRGRLLFQAVLSLIGVGIVGVIGMKRT
jgi:hypothetical protein